MQQLQLVLEILRKQAFVANRKKCSFGQARVEYLGHILSADGVAMDPAKVESILTWPIPRTVKGVRGFLGLTGYYWKFIKDYGKIARPLTKLLKKENKRMFDWNEDAQKAFVAFHQAVTLAPVLALPDFTQQFVIEYDASGLGVGAVLMQNGRPLAYFSKGFTRKVLSRSAYEKELMALILAVQHWRPYLLRSKFVVRTDHRSLKHLLSQPITSPAQQNWVAKLIGFDMEIEYKIGSSNKVADALSRRDEAQLAALTIPYLAGWDKLQKEVESFPRLHDIKKRLEKGEKVSQQFVLVGRKLFHKGRICIPTTSSWIPRLLEEFHATPMGGHSGAWRTYKRLSTNVYWPGMFKAVQDFMARCLICQKNKYETLVPAGLLQPLPLPEQIWEDISLDFIGGLPRSHGYDCVLVVVDRLSKYGHFLLLKHPYTAKSVVDLFIKEVVRLHGVP